MRDSQFSQQCWWRFKSSGYDTVSLVNSCRCVGGACCLSFSGNVYPACCWLGTVPMSLTVAVKWLGCEADDLHPYSTKVKKVWSRTSTLHTHLWHDRDNFTLPQVKNGIKRQGDVVSRRRSRKGWQQTCCSSTTANVNIIWQIFLKFQLTRIAFQNLL